VRCRTSFAIALSALVGACVRSAPPDVRVEPAPLRQEARVFPDPAKAAFRENLARARDDAEKAGWVVREVVEIPGRHAALVLYDPTAARAPATKLARVEAVGAGTTLLSAESGMIDVMKAPDGGLTWHLRGDGASFVVLHLTPCGAHCGVAKPLVLALTEQGFAVPATAPECPTCMQDEDHDGVPEFELRLVALTIAPCSRASCGPEAALVAEVRGLERWDGQSFSREAASLAPLYLERAKRSRRAAEQARRASNKAKLCPLHALQVAAELYVYSRLIGESEQDALRSSDEVMQRYDTGPCTKEYDLLAPPKSWKTLREELRAMPLPKLQR
jgi:hypothetical protein